MSAQCLLGRAILPAAAFQAARLQIQLVRIPPSKISQRHRHGDPVAHLAILPDRWRASIAPRSVFRRKPSPTMNSKRLVRPTRDHAARRADYGKRSRGEHRYKRNVSRVLGFPNWIRTVPYAAWHSRPVRLSRLAGLPMLHWGKSLPYNENRFHGRRKIPKTSGHHGPVARSGRVPVGPRTDLR
jgi:hypothetical protein